MTTTTIDATKFAYVQFTKALIKGLQDKGLTPVCADTESGLPQNEGWCFLRFSPDGAALIIPKGKARMGSLHSHVDLSGRDGYIALPKKNGKVICHFEPDLAKVLAVASQFVGAAKRPTAAPTPKAASQATVAATPSAPANPLLAEPTAEELDELAPLPAHSWAPDESLTDEELEAATQPS